MAQTSPFVNWCSWTADKIPLVSWLALGMVVWPTKSIVSNFLASALAFHSTLVFFMRS